MNSNLIVITTMLLMTSCERKSSINDASNCLENDRLVSAPHVLSAVDKLEADVIILISNKENDQLSVDVIFGDNEIAKRMISNGFGDLDRLLEVDTEIEGFVLVGYRSPDESLDGVMRRVRILPIRRGEVALDSSHREARIKMSDLVSQSERYFNSSRSMNPRR